MPPRFNCVLAFAIFAISPLYSDDLASEQQARAALAALPDPNDRQALSLWNTLGTIHQAQGKLTEAEADYRRALALSPSKTIEASLLNNLATVKQAQRDFAHADSLLKLGYEILKATNSLQTKAAGPLLANLALNFQQLGKLVDSERTYREAESVFEHTLNIVTADFVLFLSNFGLLNFEIGQYKEGIARQRRALEIQAKLPSPTNAQRAYVLNNLGLGLSEVGELAEASSFLRQAVELEQTGPASADRHLVDTLSNLASLEEKLGRYDDARQHELQAERVARATLSETDPTWGTIWNNLGLIAMMRRDFREAKSRLDRAANHWVQTLGPESPRYSLTLSNLAGLERVRGHHKQAERFANQALTIDLAYYGPSHPHVAADLTILAGEVFHLKKTQESIELLLRAKAIQDKLPPGLALARILNDLAIAYLKTGNVHEAKDYYEQAVRIYEAQQPPQSPQLATCLHQYATLLRSLGDFANAEQIEVRATRADVQTALASGFR